MKKVFFNLGTEKNVSKLCGEAGEFLELEDTSFARGFLKVSVLVNTTIPLAKGCWLAKTGDCDS